MVLVTKNAVETASFRFEIELSCYAQKTIFAEYGLLALSALDRRTSLEWKLV